MQKASGHSTEISMMDFVKYSMQQYAETGQDEWKQTCRKVEGMLTSQWSHDIRKQVTAKGPTKEISDEIGNLIENYRTADANKRAASAELENYIIRQNTSRRLRCS